jgi:hypothetical protein
MAHEEATEVVLCYHPKYLFRMTHVNHRQDSFTATGLDSSYYDRFIISHQTYAIITFTLYAVIIVAIIKRSAVKQLMSS